MVLSPWATGVKMNFFRFFPGDCFESHDSTPPSSLIHLILSSQDFPGNRYKWIILINLLMGYRNDHIKKIESTILNLSLNYFYDHRNHKSKIENCLLDRNHS